MISVLFMLYISELPSYLQTIAPSLNFDIVRNEVLEALLHLATDPIPNIRFNVAKSLEVLATTYGTTAEGKELAQQRIAPVLEGLKNDQDADVRYFATHASLKTLAAISA